MLDPAIYGWTFGIVDCQRTLSQTFSKAKTTTVAKAKIYANLLDLFHLPLHNIEVHFQWTL
jgi:hypothetical protein